MRYLRLRRGFTLLELVAVILAVGIIAGVAAPRLFDRVGAARDASARVSLIRVRDAIDLYRAHHGISPADAAALPSDLSQYLTGVFPVCPVGSDSNAQVASSDSDPIAVEAGTAAGWVYNPATGAFAINDPAYIHW